MVNIKNYKHTFFIGSNQIELIINCLDGFWSSKIIKGSTGTGATSGGNYATLKDYISDLEKQHRYTYNFFNHGYKYAKENFS